jgi:hypothetical protein
MLASLSLLVATGFWAVRLFLVPEPWSVPVAAVVAAGLLISASASIAGILVDHNRLAWRLGWAALGLLSVVALLRPFSMLWVVGVALMGGAGLAYTDRSLGGWLRSRGPVAPVPASAVGLGMILLWLPVLTALSSPKAGVAMAWLALASWVALLWFVRGWRGAMIAIRIGVPLMVLGGLLLPLPASIFWSVGAIAATLLAWTATTRLAVRPLLARGRPVPIPVELAPEAVQRAAGHIPRKRGEQS